MRYDEGSVTTRRSNPESLAIEAGDTAWPGAVALFGQANASRAAGSSNGSWRPDYGRSRRPVIDRLRLEAAEARVLCDSLPR